MLQSFNGYPISPKLFCLSNDIIFFLKFEFINYRLKMNLSLYYLLQKFCFLQNCICISSSLFTATTPTTATASAEAAGGGPFVSFYFILIPSEITLQIPVTSRMSTAEWGCEIHFGGFPFYFSTFLT